MGLDEQVCLTMVDFCRIFHARPAASRTSEARASLLDSSRRGRCEYNRGEYNGQADLSAWMPYRVGRWQNLRLAQRLPVKR